MLTFLVRDTLQVNHLRSGRIFYRGLSHRLIEHGKTVWSYFVALLLWFLNMRYEDFRGIPEAVVFYYDVPERLRMRFNYQGL